MKKIRKTFTTIAAAAALSAALTFGSISAGAEESSSGLLGALLLGAIPEEGITIHGTFYDYWKIMSFLDEIRYDPYSCTHKEHHCILSEFTDDEIKLIVSVLSAVMTH